MQVGTDSEEPGKEAKNELPKKIIFIKIPNVHNDDETNNSNTHMQSQSQLQYNNKRKKTVIPYEKPPAVFTPTEKPLKEITNDKRLVAAHSNAGTFYKPQTPNENESSSLSSNIPSSVSKQHQHIKHVLSLNENELSNKSQTDEVDTEDYVIDNISCSLVWTSIPVLSYIFPFLGHVGITDSIGRIHDFGSSHYVSVDQMTYGNPDKIVHFEITREEYTRWDKCINSVSKKYSKKTYSLCSVNGYSFCASVLNKIRYNDRNDYTACEVMKMTIGCGHYVGAAAMCKSYSGLIILVALVIIVIILCTS